MMEWQKKQARYALEQAALQAFKNVRPSIEVVDYQDLIQRKLGFAIATNETDCFSHTYMPELFRCLGKAYPFNIRTKALEDLWFSEGKKLFEEIVSCKKPRPFPKKLLLRRAKRVPKSAKCPPDPTNYRSYTSFKSDWEAWAATQTDEAEEEVAHMSALEVWWETYPDLVIVQ